METLLAIVIGVLYAAGVYMLTRRSILKLVLGLGLLGHATNLLIFTVGRLTREAPPLIEHSEEILARPYADPVPQALILTAIVIGFGVQAFAIVLIKSSYAVAGTPDFDELSREVNAEG